MSCSPFGMLCFQMLSYCLLTPSISQGASKQIPGVGFPGAGPCAPHSVMQGFKEDQKEVPKQFEDVG